MIDEQTGDTNASEAPPLFPIPQPPASAEYTVHGAVASFVAGEGWTSSDALVAKRLNRLAVAEHPEGATLDEAHALITREYGAAARRIEAVSPESHAGE